MRRLILFDIDGTLVRGRAARQAFEVALRSAYGTAGAIDTHDFSGKTDPQIARELLTGAGMADAQVDAGLAALWERYQGELEARIPDEPYRVLAGVRELLDALDASGEAALGLVTGNVVGGARKVPGMAGLLNSAMSPLKVWMATGAEYVRPPSSLRTSKAWPPVPR